jgi:hypothetical protein
MGSSAVRRRALVEKLVSGAPASTRDAARFALAHGATDGTPFPVERPHDRGPQPRLIEHFRRGTDLENGCSPQR